MLQLFIFGDLTLYLPRACQEDVAASMSSCHTDLSQVCPCRLPAKSEQAQIILIILSQICLSLLVLHCQSLFFGGGANAGLKSLGMVLTDGGDQRRTSAEVPLTACV